MIELIKYDFKTFESIYKYWNPKRKVMIYVNKRDDFKKA